MTPLLWIVLIIGAVIGAFILYKWLKPYFIKHDTTILLSGGLGSGKSLTTVKLAIILIRKNYFFRYKMYMFWKYRLANWFIRQSNKRKDKYNNKHPDKYKEPKKEYEERKKPCIYSNLPIQYKLNPWKKEKTWSKTLTEKQVLLLEEIVEYSIVVIDEFPQFIDQFMWKEELVQKNLNEFITFFRHYIAGYLIINAQSEDEIECHFRRKLNNGIWCHDFKKWLFGLFYTIRMCDYMLNDSIQTMSTTYIEENTKLHFGLFPPKNTYATRCYKKRYDNILEKAKKQKRFNDIYTNKVLRMKDYISPLDDGTTQSQKLKQLEKAEKLGRSGLNEQQRKETT